MKNWFYLILMLGSVAMAQSIFAPNVVVPSSGMPSGAIFAFAGTTCPSGSLLADGAAISRTTYSRLFTAIGEAWGEGNNSTTFNKPDLRGLFLRGRMGIANVTGSGSASSNNATFTGHGYTKSGMRIRMASGALTGLSVSTTYFVIYVDANTLAFGNTYADALAGTKIAISGSNSAVIQQWEDPDASTRVASGTGGNTGDNLGSRQEYQYQSHVHTQRGAGSGTGQYPIRSGSTGISGAEDTSASGGNETRPQNVYVTYCIKT